MNKQHLVIILLFSLLCSTLYVSTFNYGNAETVRINVSGEINTDTIWGIEASSYNLTGDVTVNSDVTLTIIKGTWIELNFNSLIINGTMQAISPENVNYTAFRGGYIIFTEHSTEWNETDRTGCIIENCIVYAGLRLQGPTCISNNTITQEILVNENSLNISNGPCIRNNFITGAGITIYSIANAQILDNIIINSPIYRPTNGISLWTSTGDTNQTIISRNLIIGATYGINIQQLNGSTPNSPVIENNTIIDNFSAGILILADSSPVICYNNIFNNGFNIENYASNSIDAKYNYWGTADTTEINQTIYDAKNNSFGVVDYFPFLLEPNLQSPTFINVTGALGGAIHPHGLIKLNYRDNQSFSLWSLSGYQITDVLVNDTSIGPVSSFTIQDISGGTTVKVEAEVEPTPTPEPSSTTKPTSNPTAQPTTKPTTFPTENSHTSPSPTPQIPESQILVVMFLITLVTITVVSLKKRLQG